jgi:hypothetical protein
MAALSFDQARTPPNPIQNNSGLPQGLAPPLGGSLMVRISMRAICDPRRSTMKQQAVEERRDWGADIMEVGLYSGLILVVTLLWVYIPA